MVMRNVILVSFLGLVACTKPNPNRCCTDEADCMANDIPVGSTCNDGLVCRGNQCIAETCTTSSSDCESTDPYCVDSLCAAACIDDTQCPGAAQDPADKFCVGGTCVVCRVGMDDCPASAPVCDGGACRACTADSDCASEACDIDSGMCLDGPSIAYASPSGSASASCTIADPCSFTHALAIATLDTTRSNVKLVQGTYTEGVTLSGTFSVTIYGSMSTIDLCDPVSMNCGLDVTDGFSLTIKDAIFSDTTGLVCSPTTVGGPMPSLTLERVSWPNGPGGGGAINGAPCKITLEQVAIHAPPGFSFPLVSAQGEVVGYNGATADRAATISIDRSVLDGGSPALGVYDYTVLQMTNSVITNQGSNGAILFSLLAIPTPSSISFNTFFDTFVNCTNDTQYAEFDSNIFLNTAVGAPANTVSGTACAHQYDLISPQASAPTGSNNITNVDPKFVNAAVTNGDFHLQAGSPAIDAADPAASDSLDYDGTTRPQGARDDIGAFELKQ